MHPAATSWRGLTDASSVRNATLSEWLGYERNTLIDKPFTDLMAVGSRIHYETHFAPLLLMRGRLAGVTVEL